MKIVISFCFFIILLANNLYAQRVLTLNDALSIAMNKGYSIQSARYKLESSQKNLEAIRLGMRSSVDIMFDIPNYTRSLSSQFNPITGSEQFYTIGSTRLESRLFINQPLIFSNGNISLIGSIFGRDQFSQISGDQRDYYTNLSIQFTQPLFVFNNQKANLEKAEINLGQSKRAYSYAERDIIYNVTSGFYNLHKAEKQVGIANEKVKQTESSYETASNKFKAGLIAEVEALQLEVDLSSSKNEALFAERNYEEAKNNFKLLIGLSLDENISVSAYFEYLGVEVDLDEAINSAIKNRPDLLNAEDNIYLSKLDVEEVDSRRTLRLDLRAIYGVNNNEGNFNTLFNNYYDNRSVVMSLSVPVLDWGRNAREVEAAEIDGQETVLSYNNLKDRIKTEVIKSFGRLNTSKARVNVLSKSVEVAEKSYSISLERFKAGTITSFDLQQSQNRLTDAKLNSLGALIDYKIALADLERITFNEYH